VRDRKFNDIPSYYVVSVFLEKTNDMNVLRFEKIGCSTTAQSFIQFPILVVGSLDRRIHCCEYLEHYYIFVNARLLRSCYNGDL
jgi:hypothetical protein